MSKECDSKDKKSTEQTETKREYKRPELVSHGEVKKAVVMSPSTTVRPPP